MEDREIRQVKMLKRENTLAVYIDFQEKLMPAMSDRDITEDRASRLAKGLRALGIPPVVTQQYTKGLGKTVESIASAIGEFEPVEKTTFSSMRNEDFVARIRNSGRKNIIVCGVEAHICVQQTVLQLLETGYNVYVPADCISSRSKEDCLFAIARMEKAGAVISTYEALLYEILEDSRAPEFKTISAIVK